MICSLSHCHRYGIAGHRGVSLLTPLCFFESCYTLVSGLAGFSFAVCGEEVVFN
jgi:hypothetical protein